MGGSCALDTWDALAHPHAIVHSYELNPGTFAFLQRNIQANGLEGRVIPHHLGLGSSDSRQLRLSRCASVTRFGTQMLGSAKASAVLVWYKSGTVSGVRSTCSIAKYAEPIS